MMKMDCQLPYPDAPALVLRAALGQGIWGLLEHVYTLLER